MYNNHSDAFEAAVAANGRSFFAKIVPTVGTQPPITEGIFKITLTGGSNTGTSLTLGSAVAAVIDVEMELPPYELENREIQLSIGIQTAHGIEYIPMGVYRVERPARERNKVAFTAYDRMIYRAENPYVSALDYPASDLDVLQEICDQMGVELDLGEDLAHVVTDELANWLSDEDGSLLAIKHSTGLYLADETGTFLTDEAGHYLALEFSLKADLLRYAIKTAPTGYSCREVIAAIAARHGKFACFDRNGNLTLRWYQETGQINFDRTAEPEPGELDYTLRQIKCAVDDDTVLSAELGSGTGIIQYSDPGMTQAQLDEIISEIGGFRYRSGKLDLLLGDPRIDPWDMFTVNWDGDSYRIPAMRLMHKFDGGIATTIEAVAESDVEREYDFEGRTLRTVERLDADSRKNDKAVEQLQVSLASEQAERRAAEQTLSQSVQDLESYQAAIRQAIDQQISDLQQLTVDLTNLSQALAAYQTDTVAYRQSIEEILTGVAMMADIPVIPTNISAFNNDVGYLTQHQDLSGYALKSDIVDLYYVDNLVAAGTDLDDLTIPGAYVSATSTNTQTLINCPVSTAFRIEIFNATTMDGYLLQRLWPNTAYADAIYQRKQQNGTWGRWYKFTGTEI